MRSPARRTLTLLTTALFVFPALGLLASAPTAAAASTGALILTDAAGDNAAGNGAGSDVTRLGATSDATQVHFFVQVNAAGVPPNPSPQRTVYHIYFTAADGQTKAAEVVWNTDGSMSGVLRNTNGDQIIDGLGVGAVTAAWVSNELKVDVNRANIGNPTDGTILPGVKVLTHRYTVPTDTVYDTTSVASYTVGSAGTGPIVPGAPANLAAVAGNNQVTLTWSAPANDGGAAITSYDVYRGTISGSGTLLASSATTSYLDAAVTNGVTYYYTVAAVNSVGAGAPSAEVSATPSGSPPPPPPPATLSFTNYPGPAAFALSTGPNPENIGFHTADGGGEPSIGVNWLTGNVMVTGGWAGDTQSVYRVVFDDTQDPPTAQWIPVSPRAGLVGTVDAILFTDSQNGRTWAGGILHGCSHIAISDNDGQTWIQTAESCALPSFDHETIGAWPWAEPLDPANGNPAFPKVVYYCAQADGLAQCASSFDGGITYNPGVPLPCTYLHGSIRGGPDGAVYLPFRDCGAQWLTGSPLPGYASGQAIVVSRDNGLTWTRSMLPVTYSPPLGWADPAVAVGRGDEVEGGRVYAIALAADHHPYVMTSDDGAQTWQNKVDLTTVGDAIGVKAVTFLQVTVGDDDRAAVSFEGTKDASNTAGYYGGSDCGAGTMVWHKFMGVTYDGGVTWSVVDATPNDPIQRGPIWGSGGDPAGGCRNLLDFESMTMDAEGRPLSVWADGCISAACRAPGGTPSQSRNSLVTITRLTSGRGLLAEFDDDGGFPLNVNAGGPYSGLVGNAIGLAASASGGSAPYTFSWSVAASPAGSAGGAFNNPNAAAATFTPDVVGAYTLQVSVTDALGSVVSASALLTATQPLTGGCAEGGVTIAGDDSDDGGGAGTASEAFCLRASDSVTTIDFYFDLKGRGVAPGVDPIYYDLYFTDELTGVPFLIEATWDGASLGASFVDPNTFLPLPIHTVNVEWVGPTNTLHVSWVRDQASPADGATLGDVYLDINHCEGDLCTLVFDDYVPDSKDGTYLVGGSGGSGGGARLPECGDNLGDDPAGDTLQTGAGRGLRDLTRFSASDTDEIVKFCWTVVDFDDRPVGTNDDANAKSGFNVFWNAEYEGSGIAYSASAVINPDGSVDATNSNWLKGVCDPLGDCLTGVEAGDVTVEVKGRTIVLSVAKSDIGSPDDGDFATGMSVDVRPFADQSTSADRKDLIAAENFEFGQRFVDTSPPSAVTDLAAADAQTGDALVLTWTAATDDVGVIEYEVLRATTSGGETTLVGTPATPGFTDTGLTTGATYYYVVKAKDAAGNLGAASNEASGTPTTGEDATPPTVPTNLVACGTSTNTICVSWTGSTDPESAVANYNVYRDGALVGSPTTTSFIDGPLSSDTSYSYAVSAVNTFGYESAQSASITLTTLSTATPEIAITSPLDGATVTPPFSISGTYSTTGESEPTGGAWLDRTLPWQVAEWATSDFVQDVIRTSEYRQLLAEDLAGVAGFLSAYPSPDGTIQVLLTGAKPTIAPTQSRDSHWPLVYRENVQVSTLAVTTPHKPKHVVTLDDIRNGLAAAPTGPITPGIESGIGPGTAIQMHNPIDGLTYICTASFLYENPATGKYYLMTAGHCLLDKSVANSVTGAHGASDAVYLCYANCVNNWIGAGSYIELPTNATYKPVAYAGQGGVGNDAGFIEIPPDVQQFLRPWMYLWSGPTAPGAAVTGDVLVHYGHGVGSGPVFATQGRAAVTVSSNANSFNAAGYIWNGDSGSSIGIGEPDADRLVTGGPAVGIVTHATGVATPVGFPGNNFFGTTLNRALNMAEGALGFRPVLVTQDAEIRLPGPVTPVSLNTAIVTPASGATFAQGVGVDVTGTATFPLSVGPGTEILRYYLARDQCGAPAGQTDIDDNLHLRAAPHPTLATCGSLAHPVGPVWEAVLGPLTEEYPAEPAPTADVLLDRTRQVTARLWLGCYKGSSSNPACAPSAVNDLEIRLEAGGTLIGSARVQNSLVFGADPTPVDFAFTPLVDAIPVGATPTLEWHVHMASGPVFLATGGPAFASYVNLPLGVAAARSVEVSLDPLFGAAKTVAASGTSGWSATIPATLLAAGANTVYARAVQGATADATPASVGIVVEASGIPPTASFTTATSGLTVTFTDTSTPGDAAITTLEWSFGDGATDVGSSVVHTYATGGTYTVTLLVRDANSLSDTAASDVSVAAVTTWTIDVRVTDEGGAEVLPRTNAGMVPAGDGAWSYLFDGVPPPGTYTIEARLLRDGSPVASDTSQFVVPNTNLPPVVDPIPAQVVQQGDTLVFTVTGSDPNGDALAWALVDGPEGLTFDANTRTAQWATTFDDLGAYWATFSATDGEFTAETTVAITVLLTPRVPTLAPLPLQSVVELSPLTAWLHATTQNGDSVAFSTSALPVGLEFTPFSNNSALIEWTPAVGSKGMHSFSVTVDSMGLTDTETITIRVLQLSALTLERSGTQVVPASPAEVVTLNAIITNTGPSTDTFSFSVTDTSGWTKTTPASVTLASGASAPVSFQVTVAPNGVLDSVTLKATSVGNPTVFKSLAWTINVPIVATVEFDPATLGSSVTGVVRVVFLDGTPVAGAMVTVTETPPYLGSFSTSRNSGLTTADGEFAIDLGDTTASLPGEHDVVVTVSKGGRSATIRTSYEATLPGAEAALATPETGTSATVA